MKSFERSFSFITLGMLLLLMFVIMGERDIGAPVFVLTLGFCDFCATLSRLVKLYRRRNKDRNTKRNVKVA